MFFGDSFTTIFAYTTITTINYIKGNGNVQIFSNLITQEFKISIINDSTHHKVYDKKQPIYQISDWFVNFALGFLVPRIV